MNYDRVIWDFNGTILDDVETGIVSVNKLLRDRGLKTLNSKEEYRAVFGFPVRDYYERLGFDFSKEPYEVIAPLWVEQYMINVKNAVIFDGVVEAMELFKSQGIGQVLLSATELSMLKGQISELGIADNFEEVLGMGDIHASSKEGLAIEWRKKHQSDKVLLIGDTDHDLQVAKAIGADCVLISQGHQSEEYLLTLTPLVFGSLTQAMRYLEASADSE